MNILHLHPGPDTGGQSMAGKRVLEAGGDKVRVFVHNHHPFGYEAATLWDAEEVRRSYRWADVVVVHNDPRLLERAENGRRKPVVLHHHGSRFRGNPVNMYAEGEAIGARQIVSTVDLLLSVPEGKTAEWIPQVVDVDRMRAMRAVHYVPGGKLRVMHAPTNRMIKGTRHVVKAARFLRRKADIVIVQRQPWSICLAFKAQSDIFIDQLNLGYGNNAIEAWAMDVPVMASASPDILALMRLTYGGDLPFFLTSANTLLEDLLLLFDAPELRAQWAERGRAHVERYHAPEAWAARARQLYSGETEEMVA